jgi:enoyl-CoA hydratase/carnithine racemase
MAVYIEKDGPMTTVILSRPDVRNAVDRETAAELADAFRDFEADEEALANVLRHGLNVLEQEARRGAARFANGSGHHGKFE